MSTAIGKRKRARKACIPCHQRKRKCDAKYPCNMCTIYEYNCSYVDNHALGTADGATHAPPPAGRGKLNGGSTIASLGAASSQAESPPTSPTVTTGVSTIITTPAGVAEEQKSKCVGVSSAMAFPHVLGVALGSDSPPEVHSFAYNFGIRPEEPSSLHGLLAQLISEDDLRSYSEAYISALAPIGDFVNPEIYAQRCQDYYHGSASPLIAFGAVAAGIAALGSFLSAKRHPREPDLVRYAKDILDDPASMRVLDVDHIVAWGLRVLYLRATSRPSNAWIASCTAMHLCEALGLHEDEKVKKIASNPDAAALGHDTDRLRRIFWISWAGHNLLSYEYDRSSVYFRAVTCQAITPRSGSVADQFVQIAHIIPAPNSPFRLAYQPPTPREELFERIKALQKLQSTDPFLVTTKGDLAFCFYRRIYQLKMGISDEIIQIVIECGSAAVKAAEQLASQGHLFWNVIGSVFQYACVLLAMDTPAAFAHIGAAFKGLENLVKAADTRITREALAIAQHLLSLSMAKKRKELAQLESFEANFQSEQAQPAPEVTVNFPDTGWELDWDQFFLDPSLPLFNGVV